MAVRRHDRRRRRLGPRRGKGQPLRLRRHRNHVEEPVRRLHEHGRRRHVAADGIAGGPRGRTGPRRHARPGRHRRRRRVTEPHRDRPAGSVRHDGPGGARLAGFAGARAGRAHPRAGGARHRRRRRRADRGGHGRRLSRGVAPDGQRVVGPGLLADPGIRRRGPGRAVRRDPRAGRVARGRARSGCPHLARRYHLAARSSHHAGSGRRGRRRLGQRPGRVRDSGQAGRPKRA